MEPAPWRPGYPLTLALVGRKLTENGAKAELEVDGEPAVVEGRFRVILRSGLVRTERLRLVRRRRFRQSLRAERSRLRRRLRLPAMVVLCPDRVA